MRCGHWICHAELSAASWWLFTGWKLCTISSRLFFYWDISFPGVLCWWILLKNKGATLRLRDVELTHSRIQRISPSWSHESVMAWFVHCWKVDFSGSSSFRSLNSLFSLEFKPYLTRAQSPIRAGRNSRREANKILCYISPDSKLTARWTFAGSSLGANEDVFAAIWVHELA